MRLSTFTALCVLLLVQGCATHTQCKREQYAIQYAEASFAQRALGALDAGDVTKARQIELSSLSICLGQLDELSGPAGLDQHDLKLREKLAKKVLDYATANRTNLATEIRSLQMVHNLEALLTEPAELRRAADLRAYLGSTIQAMQNP